MPYLPEVVAEATEVEVLAVADSEAATVRVVVEVISAMVVMEVVGDMAVVIMMEAAGGMGVVIGIMMVAGVMEAVIGIMMVTGGMAVGAIMEELDLGFMDLGMVQAITAATDLIMEGMAVIMAIRPQWLPYRQRRRFTFNKHRQSANNTAPVFGITAVIRKAITLM